MVEVRKRSIDLGGILVALFGFFIHGTGAYVQLNDPQPMWWIIAYSSVSILCFYIVLIKLFTVRKLPMEIYPYFWYIYIIPSGLGLRSFNQLSTLYFSDIDKTLTIIQTYTVIEWLEIEVVRELLGCLFILVWEITLFDWCIDYSYTYATNGSNTRISPHKVEIASVPVPNYDPSPLDDPKSSMNSSNSTHSTSNNETNTNIITDDKGTSMRRKPNNPVHSQVRQRYQVNDAMNNPEHTLSVSNRTVKPFRIENGTVDVRSMVRNHDNDTEDSDFCTLLSPPSLLTFGTILVWASWFYALKKGKVHVDPHCQGMLV